MSDSEDEYEEETVYLVVDLGPEMSPEVLERLGRENAEMTYLGTEEGEQFIQLNGTTFHGHLDETIATNLLFEVHERKREGPGLLPLLTSIKREGEDEAARALRQQQQQQQQQLLHSELSFAVKTDNVVMCNRVTLIEKINREKEKEKDAGSSSKQDINKQNESLTLLLAQCNAD
ncbi:hypothetical protein BDC45DRAFT_537689 [Circinella umbellata]|nr:hypothetical protein BDC45DRAFT_537689 [Circinella umbellata]